MPRYNLRLGNSRITLAETTEPLGSRFLDRGKPQTYTDSGGSLNGYSWQGQELNRDELRKVKEIRETGGIVAYLFESKATMRFGTGAELQSENDDLQEWLNANFENLDLLTLDLGADGTWYPYAPAEAVETRGGDFSHIEPIEPWTILPLTDKYGEIQYWEQELSDKTTQRFDTDEIGAIVLNKSAARDKVGVSEVLRSEEEITQYKANQRAVDKAIEIAGFPHHVWTVGAEGRSPVDDNDLRRVRNLIDNMDGDTQFVVGPDIDHDKITTADFDFEGVTKRDLRILTTAIGLPFEMAGYGREGMGSGSETDLIMAMLSLQNEVARRRFETQFVREFVKPVVAQYSPFDAETEPIAMHIPSFLDDRADLADLIAKIGDYMTNAEIREKLDLAPIEDEELAESYRSPKAVEEAEEEPDDGGMGGLFGSSPSDTDFRELQTRGHPISNPDECDGQVIEGPQGGLRCIPEGEESGDTGDGEQRDVSPSDPTISRENIGELREQSDSKEEFAEAVTGAISEQLGIQTNDITEEEFTEEQIESVGAGFDMLTRADEERMQELGAFLDDVSSYQLEDGLRIVNNEMAGNHAQYSSQHKFIEINTNGFEEVSEEDAGLLVAREDSFLEDIVIHEVGHALHHKAIDEQGGNMGDVRDVDLPEERIEEEISAGAAVNGTEATAEMFLYQSLGNELPDDLQDLYDNDLQGPEPVDLT